MIKFKLFRNSIVNNWSPVKFEKIKNYKKAALVFSEGDSELEQLLLTCFKGGFKTIASCCGHDKKKMKHTFVLMSKKSLIIYFILFIVLEKKKWN